LRNNFELANRDGSTVYDKAQVKALMNFMNHAGGLGLFNNTFANNTGLKGIINIERNPSESTGFLLFGNRFVNSSALMDSNVLNLRTRVDRAALQGHDPKCGGITLRANRFERSVGCQYVHGVVHLYCYDAGHSSPKDQVKYVPEIDAQYFIGEHFNGTLGDPVARIPGSSSTDYRNSETGFARGYRPLIPGLGDRAWRQSKALRSNLGDVMLDGNTYLENLAGDRRSVVHVEGFPVVVSKRELYERNENWFQLLVDQRSVFAALKPGDSAEARAEALAQTVRDKKLQIDKTFLADYPSKSESILTVWRPLQLEVSGSIFDGNFVVDDVYPTSLSLDGLTQRNQS